MVKVTRGPFRVSWVDRASRLLMSSPSWLAKGSMKVSVELMIVTIMTAMLQRMVMALADRSDRHYRLNSVNL